MNYPPPPPQVPPRLRRPIWQWGCGALIVLVVCGGIAAIASPKSPSSPAVSVPTVAPGASVTSAPIPTATVVMAQPPPPPTVAPSPTIDIMVSLSATSTALAKLPPNARYAPPGCTSGVQYGSLCKDGSLSTTVGQGACSGHKGVQQKLTCP